MQNCTSNIKLLFEAKNLTNEMPELHQSFKELHTAIDEGFHQMIGAVKNDNKLISSE